MKKWEITNEGKFYGEAGPTGIGIFKWADNNYYLGQWDDGDINGLGIRRYENGNFRMGMFANASMSYPTMIITQKRTMEILFDIDSQGIETHLNIDLESGDWYFDRYKGDDPIGTRFIFEHEEGQITLKNFPLGETFNKKITLPRRIKFSSRPIKFKEDIFFPEIKSWDGFTWEDSVTSNGISYTSCENSTRTAIGVGAINWGDGTFALSSWKNGGRFGWNVYRWTDTYSFFYNSDSGRTIEVQVTKNGNVNICDTTPDNWSTYLRYSNGVLTYSETENNIYSRKGLGISIRNYDTIDFVKFVDNTPDSVIATYSLVGTEYSGSDPDYQEAIKLENKMSGGTIKNRPISRKTSSDNVAAASSTSGGSSNNVISTAEDEIKNLIGLDEVKNQLVKIKAYISKNKRDELVMNMAFFGNAGTGKNKVAELMSKLLYEYKAINNQEFLSFSAYDFKSLELSGIAENIKRYIGGVIYISDISIIDEPDSYGGKPYRDFIAKTLKLYEGTNTCFILGGEKYALEEMLYNCGPISSEIRFKIQFPDYTKDELRKLITQFANHKDYEIEADALSLIDEILEQKRYAPEWANADTAYALIEDVMLAQNVRTKDEPNNKTITSDDVQKYMDENSVVLAGNKELGSSSARKELEKLVGLEEIKKSVDDLVAFFAINRNKKTDFHMSFLGAPGTGKTEVARIIGKLLHEEGLLPTSKFIECTKDSFIGKYIGHTTPKTRELINRAMGGVLYIDEAYSLAETGENGFGKEAIAELLKEMEDKRGKFCVILSGYTDEMKKLFNTNPGFKSRVKFELIFNDYNDDEMKKIADIFLKKDDYTINDDALDLVVKIVAHLRNKPHYASARTLREVLSKVEIAQAGRTHANNETSRLLTMQDVISAYGETFVKSLASTDKQNQKSVMASVSSLEEAYKKIALETFEKAKERIVETVIAIYNNSEDHKSESSGFIISKDGYAVTCAHCVKGAENVQVRVRLVHRGRNIDIKYDADVLAYDEDADVAVIKIKTEDEFDYVALNPQDREDLAPLSRVFLLGYPFGVSRFDKMSINEGRIASYQRNKGNGKPDSINLDISAKSGNSGSCVIDGETGLVIGVLCGSEISNNGTFVEEVNYCRPISYVWDLIKNNQSNDTENLINLMFKE